MHEILKVRLYTIHGSISNHALKSDHGSVLWGSTVNNQMQSGVVNKAFKMILPFCASGDRGRISIKVVYVAGASPVPTIPKQDN